MSKVQWKHTKESKEREVDKNIKKDLVKGWNGEQKRIARMRKFVKEVMLSSRIETLVEVGRLGRSIRNLDNSLTSWEEIAKKSRVNPKIGFPRGAKVNEKIRWLLLMKLRCVEEAESQLEGWMSNMMFYLYRNQFMTFQEKSDFMWLDIVDKIKCFDNKMESLGLGELKMQGCFKTFEPEFFKVLDDANTMEDADDIINLNEGGDPRRFEAEDEGEDDDEEIVDVREGDSDDDFDFPIDD